MSIFDKEELRKFREAFDKVKGQLEKDFDVAIELGRITHNPSSFSGKITVSKNVEGTVVQSPYAGPFMDNLWRHGLKKEDLGRTFTTGSGTYRIMGYNKSAKKYSIIAENVDTGVSFKFSAVTVKMCLGEGGENS